MAIVEPPIKTVVVPLTPLTDVFEEWWTEDRFCQDSLFESDSLGERYCVLGALSPRPPGDDFPPDVKNFYGFNPNAAEKLIRFLLMGNNADKAQTINDNLGRQAVLDYLRQLEMKEGNV